MRRWIWCLPLLAACGNDQSTTSQLVPGHDAPGPDAPVVLPARPDAPPAPQPDAAPSPVYRGIFAPGSSLWVVGDKGTILHDDDGIWRAEPSGTAADLLAIAGDDQDIWVVGKDGTVLQSGGTGVWYQPVGHLSGEWLLSVAVADGVAFIGGVEMKATVRGRGLEVNLLFDNSYEYSAISGTHDGDMWLAANWIENTTMPTGVLFHGGTAGWTEVARAREPGLPDLDFDAILAENGRLILGASGKPCFSTQVSRFDGTTWSADKIAPSSDGICSLPATRHGSPTAILVDGMQGVMGTGMGLLITDPSGEWVPLVEDSPVLGLAGTPSDFWAVGTSIRHYVDRTAVEQVR